LEQLWYFEDKLVKVFYLERGENWAVDSCQKHLQIFARPVKRKSDEGVESRTLGRRQTCHTWVWARSRGMETDKKDFEMDQGGQAGDKVLW